MLYVRMLFSALVDADFLYGSSFAKHQKYLYREKGHPLDAAYILNNLQEHQKINTESGLIKVKNEG